MRELLERSRDAFIRETCCHTDRPIGLCDCSNCIHNGFYEGVDTYVCMKKNAYYVLKYGPAYVNEIYHFLAQSNLINNHPSEQVRILSIGCGVGTDLCAIRKQMAGNAIGKSVTYQGFDIEPIWSDLRNPGDTGFFQTGDIMDLLPQMDLRNYELIFLNKFFSTIKKQGLGPAFSTLLRDKILAEWTNGQILVFNDVNHLNMGRDEFDAAIKPICSQVDRYFFDIDKAYRGDYIAIQNTQNVCDIPDDLPIEPIPQVTKTVFFVYHR